jgi:N12 class adenine-specific DNA methylase
MANVISPIGNHIFLNQNTPFMATKFANYHSRVSFSDMVTSDMFEENNKKLKETREAEEAEEIENYLYDSQAYTNTPNGKKRQKQDELEQNKEQTNKTEHQNIIDSKNHKIDVQV